MPESAATSQALFLARRRFVKALGLGTIGGAAGATGLHYATQPAIVPGQPIVNVPINPDFADAGRPLTASEKVYRFTNFYEFTIDKRLAIWRCRDFKIEPWKLLIHGEVEKEVTLDIDDIRKMNLQQRVYRFRCVEAWAMTVPWIGVPLADLIKLAGPKSNANFVSLYSFEDPQLAPRQNNDYWPWPYREGLTIQEAMNPLALAAIGLYGQTLQPQNGAPMRVVLPWKYGYKGPKSVVRIQLTRVRPPTFWNTLQPDEYGFFGNVNPELPHPRWSQKREALIGEWGRRVDTQKFNGYGQWVADMYPLDRR